MSVRMKAWNSTFNVISKSMKRSVFNSVATLKRTRIKSSRHKSTPIRQSARGEECTIRLPGVCNYDPTTTVLCHDNRIESGKGMGLKASDTHAAYGCSACHDVLDGRAPRPDGLSRELMLSCFDAGVEQTHRILRRKGLI